MDRRNIIVIGASAGGFAAIRRLITDLPRNLEAAIFIVWHMSPDMRGILPDVLNRQKSILAAHVVDIEPIVLNRVYIAPPDRHLIIEKGRVRVTRGPSENRFRPAIDPMFRSAAYAYGARVIGIVLSGALDDGTAGLHTIKRRGGLAIVQDPSDAEVPSMPENALDNVEVDYLIPVADMPALLEKLTATEVNDYKETDMDENKKTSLEVQIAMQDHAPDQGVLRLGDPTFYTCPECHGVLSVIREGNITRYRCHTGHAFSIDSLLASTTEIVEDGLWNAIRGMEESIILLNQLGDFYAENNQPRIASVYFRKAKDAEERAKLVRKAVLNHEQLSTRNFSHQAGNTSDQNKAT